MVRFPQPVSVWGAVSANDRQRGRAKRNGMRHGREGNVHTSHEARPDPNRGVVKFDFPIGYP
jgi:hypothetical protein